ncbi:hypothetical protein VP01_1184g2 [Puccinia sorghi]|uniref:Uncharacterized protein n=1 Tax=Puccinia sorghi TaxID=27349 RepID=A0A0L6VR70_9BASI|nr:hypothetical protein VP01_1184g2 [Puccinia sorghi]
MIKTCQGFPQLGDYLQPPHLCTFSTAYEARYDDSNNESSTSEESEVEELVMALLSLKRKQYQTDSLRIKSAPDITEYLFNLNSSRFKQDFRTTQDSLFSLISLIENHPFLQNKNFLRNQSRIRLCLISVTALFLRISKGMLILYCSQVSDAKLELEIDLVILLPLLPHHSV